MSRRGVVDLVSQIVEVLAVSQQNRRGARQGGESNPLSPAFEADEQEVLVLANRTAAGSTELVLVMLVFWGASKVVLKVIGIEDPVAEVVEQRSVPVICS